MKIIRDIVWSSDEPLDKNVLWLNNGLIKYYGPNGWESLKYFSMLEDNIVGSIDAETHKIALSGSLPQDTYYLKYEDEKRIVLDNWAEVCQMPNSSTYNELIKFNVAPYAAHAIGVYNAKGVRVGHIELEQFKPKYSKRLFRFGLLSDVHNSSDESAEPTEDIQRALKFFNDKQSVSFTCISGDLTNSASERGFSIYQKNVQESSPNTPVYATPGNHDAQSKLNVERWKKYTGCEPTYEFTHTVDGIPFHFIFLGMYYWSLGTDGKPYKDEDIEWLAERLEAHKGEKCFVITHLFFPDRAGNLLKIYPQGNWLQGEQLTKLENLCKTYPNTIWFSGHSHWKWYLQKYQATENVYQNEQEGSYCVHVSGCASPIDSNGQPNTSGARVTKPLESEGAIVDVYEDYIDIRCMDLKNMLYLPIAQYRLTMKNNTSYEKCNYCREQC